MTDRLTSVFRENQRTQPNHCQCHWHQPREAIANVELDANGIRLVASITVEAVEELGITEGSAVTAIVKASDVILAVEG
jgi:molybdopterin-binding protein